MSGRILIVHAALVMRMMIRDHLVASGYEVVGEASNGHQALQKYRSLVPDVVTMDMVLPELDGVAAVAAIIREFPEARVIMCTSTGRPALLVEAIKAGAKAFITKPFPRAKIIETIENVLD